MPFATATSGHNTRWAHWLVVLALLALAGILRLGHAGANAFASDEARLSWLALRMARDGELITSGIATSAGARNLPASVYAFLPPYWASTDALIATQYVGLLNLLAIAGLVALARRAVGTGPALLALLYLTAAPFAVFFARNIWTQNLLLPLYTLWLVLAYWGVTSQRWPQLARLGAVGVAGVAFQVHLAGAPLILALAYTVVRWRWWRTPWPLVAGGALAFVPLAPFLWQAACCAPELIGEYTDSIGRGASQISAQALGYTAQLAAQTGWDYLALGREEAISNNPLLAVGTLIWLAAGAVGWWHHRRQADPNQRPLIELMLVLVAVPIITFTYERTPVRLHYFLGALPALALLAGGIALWPWRGRSVLVAGAIGITLIWSGQAFYSLSRLQTTLAEDGMGMALRAVRDVALALPDDVPIMIHTQSDDPVTRGEPATWNVLLWERPHRITGGWTTLIIPSEPAILMTDVDGMPAWEEIIASGLADPSAITTLVMMQRAPAVYYIRHDGTAPRTYRAVEPPVDFENGLRLVGWQVRVISGRLRLATLYQVQATPVEPGAWHQFTHARPPSALDGPPPLTADIPLSATNWRAGDWLVGLADVLDYEPEQTYWFDVGHYDLTSGARFARTDGGDSVRLGPVQLIAGALTNPDERD